MTSQLKYLIQQFAIAHKEHKRTNTCREIYEERCDALLEALQNSTKQERAEAIRIVILPGGNTIGHLISFVGGLQRHRQRAYFRILEELALDTAYHQTVVNVLLLKNQNGLTIGNSFASQPSSPEIQLYLAILDKLLPSRKNDVVRILLRQTYGMTTARLISEHQNTEATKALLCIVNKLLEFEEKDAWKLLIQPGKEDGRTMGHLIARYQKAEVMCAYLAMLTPLVDSNLEWVLNLLMQPAKDGWTMGHLIARYQKAEVMHAYLAMLTQLLIANKTDVLDLLNQQSRDEWTLGHLIARWQNTEIQKVFGELIAALFIAMPSYTENEIKQYTYLKPMIAKYLLQLRDNPKNREILEAAITQDNLLGALCHKPTGTGFYKRLVHGNTDSSSCIVIEIKAKLKEFKEFKSNNVADIEMTIAPCTTSALKLSYCAPTAQKTKVSERLRNVNKKSCDLRG